MVTQYMHVTLHHHGDTVYGFWQSIMALKMQKFYILHPQSHDAVRIQQ